ncbi:amino acid racemase [Altererythrobacter sp.]|uniref:aspartate/glutamate racemase family protein n=1 Tax=Altererythrobacter sp. TaxID=1872480 RepID=UPI001B0D728A|nr:amino acid racemase [Altererythrobacter sp.]MBO6609824.1 amino acid racemase [Altererythrobacter sp.]MBO6640974.1 amino acid racemase [Altererythrobacter sp.]MBO6708328.1 amino acid racemase [Altererythrobacter sp.]
MRKLGLIGGMSWLSTRTYYSEINRLVQRKLGKHASAPMAIESLDYRSLNNLESDEDWARATQQLVDAARRLEAGGAERIVITANVMHRAYDDVVDAVDTPVLHIADCTAHRLEAGNIGKVLLLGMRSAVSEGYLRDRIEQRGVKILPMNASDIEEVHRLIVEELKLGKASRDAERKLKTIITVSEQAGAKAVILACTELEMVVDVDANILPIFDTARIHCQAAADWAMSDKAES